MRVIGKAPHPNPLPSGEREKKNPHPDPLSGREREKECNAERSGND